VAYSYNFNKLINCVIIIKFYDYFSLYLDQIHTLALIIYILCAYSILLMHHNLRAGDNFNICNDHVSSVSLHYIRALSSRNKICNCALRTRFSNHVNFCIIFCWTCIEIQEWLLLSNKLCRLKWHDDNRSDYSGRNSSEQFNYHTWWPYNDRIINKQFDDIIALWKFCISYLLP
jgi:hypothetical protein